MRELLDRDARSAFDLMNGPVIRGHLVKLAGDSHVFILTAHHIICDGWSINVIVSELAEIYSALCRGETPQLQEALQFSAYARGKAARDPADLAKTEGFWLEQFRTPAVAAGIADRSAAPDAKKLQRREPLPANRRKTLPGDQEGRGTTRKHAVRHSARGVPGSDGTTGESERGGCRGAHRRPIAARGSDSRRPLREFPADPRHLARGNQGVRALVGDRKAVLDAYEHQDYTFGTLVRKLSLPRDTGRLPLAEIQFNLERVADRMELTNLDH